MRAPRHMSDAAVLRAVGNREGWILSKQQLMATVTPPTTRAITPGTAIPFLGRLRTVVQEPQTGDAGNGGARNGGRRRHATARRKNLIVRGAVSSRGVYHAVNEWYRSAALRVFRQRIAVLRRIPAIAELGEPKNVSLRRMRRRWGSCSADRRIILNPELAGAAVTEIDYVILHELCHFREHNHSRRFYRLMDERMPDWRRRRERLNARPAAGFLNAPE